MEEWDSVPHGESLGFETRLGIVAHRPCKPCSAGPELDNDAGHILMPGLLSHSR